MRYSTRKKFLDGAAIGLGALPALTVAVRAAQFDYKLSHSLPVEHPLHIRLVQMWEQVKVETQGRLVVHTFPNSELAGSNDSIPQLRLGAIQFAANANTVFSGVAPIASISSVPLVFTSTQQWLRLLDGALGTYVRDQIATKGIHVLPKAFDNGMRQVISSTKPIKTLSDIVGFKLLGPAAALFVDFWKTLGAIPLVVAANEFYTALQTHIADGSDNPLISIEAFRWYEVQRYLSITNHTWGCFWLGANEGAWNALPGDIHAIVVRNQAKYAELQRRDSAIQNASVADKLRRQGLAVSNVDALPWREKLGGYYAKWKSEFGTTAWGLIEESAGKIG